MIGLQKRKVGEIPILEVCKTADSAKALPVVVYFHGFTSAKEHNLPIAFLLAEKGFRVLLPDSILHGEREDNVSPLDRQLAFWDIVIQNVSDLGMLKEDMETAGLLTENRIGVAGTSMGGITTSAVLTQYDWVKAAAVLMGSPKLTTYAKKLLDVVSASEKVQITKEEAEELLEQINEFDLAKHPTTLKERPLLFWHGEADSVVPFELSYSFFQDIRHTYKEKEHIKFLKEKDTDHKVSRFAILETVKWFAKHI